MIKLVGIFALIALVSASDVLDFDDSNFAQGIEGEDIVLVEFFAPWCGHCKRLAPEYEKAATTLKNNDPAVKLAKVDCTANQDTCSKFGVSGYPTLKIFRDGTPSEYEGPREADGIVKYMRSKAGPSSKVLQSAEDVDKFVSHFDHSIVGFFEAEDSDIAKQFKKLADALSEDYRFAHTLNKEAAEKYGYSDDVVIFQPKRLHNKFEEKQAKYDGDAVLHKMKSWVHDNYHGLAGHKTTSNAGQFKTPLITVYYDLDYVRNVKGSNYWRNRVMKVAKNFAGRNINFAVASVSDFSQELSEFGIEGPGDKPVVAARNAKEEKFVMEEEFSMDNLEIFVTKVLSGALKPYLKSEPLPEDNDGPVKTLVAENFNEIVNDETKDVLIEFYAPWCGHCKNLAPKYEELGEKLQDDDSVVIAKMDATANDVPSNFEVRGFPTLYYVPKNNSPRKYEGGREVDDFIKYLAKESTDGLKGYNRNGKKNKSKKTDEL